MSDAVPMLLKSELYYIQTHFDLTHQWNLELRQLKLHEKSVSGKQAIQLCRGSEVCDLTDLNFAGSTSVLLDDLRKQLGGVTDDTCIT